MNKFQNNFSTTSKIEGGGQVDTIANITVDELHEYVTIMASKIAKMTVEENSVITGTITAAAGSNYTVQLATSNSQVNAQPLTAEIVYTKDDYVYLIKGAASIEGGESPSYFIFGRVDDTKVAFAHASDLERFNGQDSYTLTSSSFTFERGDDEDESIFWTRLKTYKALKIEGNFTTVANVGVIITYNYADGTKEEFKLDAAWMQGQPNNMNSLYQARIIERTKELTDNDTVTVTVIGSQNVTLTAGTLNKYLKDFSLEVKPTNKSYFRNELPEEQGEDTVRLEAKLKYLDGAINNGVQYYWFVEMPKDITAADLVDGDKAQINGVGGDRWYCLNSYSDCDVVGQNETIRVWNKSDNFTLLDKFKYLHTINEQNVYSFDDLNKIPLKFINKIKCVAVYEGFYINSEIFELVDYSCEQYSVSLKASEIEPHNIVSKEDFVEFECIVTNNNPHSGGLTAEYTWLVNDTAVAEKDVTDKTIRLHGGNRSTDEQVYNYQVNGNTTYTVVCKVEFKKNGVLIFTEQTQPVIVTSYLASSLTIQEYYQYYISYDRGVSFTAQALKEDTAVEAWLIQDGTMTLSSWLPNLPIDNKDFLTNPNLLDDSYDKSKIWYIYYTYQKRTYASEDTSGELVDTTEWSQPVIGRALEYRGYSWQDILSGTEINQLNIFNSLTNNGKEDGVYYTDGEGYFATADTAPQSGKTYFTQEEYTPTNKNNFKLKFKTDDKHKEYFIISNDSYTKVADDALWNSNIAYFLRNKDGSYKAATADDFDIDGFMSDVDYFTYTTGYTPVPEGEVYSSEVLYFVKGIYYKQFTGTTFDENIIYYEAGEGNKLYINATYINTGTLRVGNNTNEKFYASIHNPEVRIAGFTVDTDSISNNKEGSNKIYIGTDGVQFGSGFIMTESGFSLGGGVSIQTSTGTSTTLEETIERKLQVVYSDKETEPNKPYKTEEGTNIGTNKDWHEGLTDNSIWMCQKISDKLDGPADTWGAVIQIQGLDGTDAPTIQMIYTNASDTPSTPTGDVPTGWTTDEDTLILAANERIYMSSRYSNEKIWSKPIPYSALDGAPGEDGSDIEFVYYRVEEGYPTPTDRPSYDSNGDLSPHWTPSPAGITATKKEEYMSFRIKPAGKDSWDPFSEPALWAKWGEKGQDGDGIDYQFAVSTSSALDQDFDLLDWKDDPTGVTTEIRYEFVKIGRTDGADKTKTTYSPPRIWAVYSESVYVLSIDEDFIAIPAASDGKILTTDFSFPTVYAAVYLGRDLQENLTKTDFTISGSDKFEITKSMEENKLKLTLDWMRDDNGDPITENITSRESIKIEYKNDKGTVLAEGVISINKQMAGADGEIIKILTSTTAVKKKDSNYTPSYVTATAKKKKGSGVLETVEDNYKWTVTNGRVSMSKDENGYYNATQLNIYPTSEDDIQIRLYSNETTPALLDVSTVSVVENGQDGRSTAYIAEYYGVSSSAATQPTEWTWVDSNYNNNIMPTVSATNKYLWNKEVYYSEDPDEETKQLISTAKIGESAPVIEYVYEDKILSQTVIGYYKTTTNTEPDVDSENWEDYKPTTLNPGDYLWKLVKFEYTYSPTSYDVQLESYVSNDGTSVTVDEVKYGASNSSTTEPAEWETSISDVDFNEDAIEQYLWTRITFTDGTTVDSNVRQGSVVLTLALDNDSDVIAKSASGQIVGNRPTVTASLLRNGTAIAIPSGSLTVATEDETGVTYTLTGSTLTFGDIPADFEEQVFTFEYRTNSSDENATLSKQFKLSSKASDIDYNLDINPTVINSTDSDGYFYVKIRQTNSDGTDTFITGPNTADSAIVLYKDNTRVGNNVPWNFQYSKGTTTPITFTIKDKDNDFEWDSETVEFVKNGSQGEKGRGILDILDYYAYTTLNADKDAIETPTAITYNMKEGLKIPSGWTVFFYDLPYKQDGIEKVVRWKQTVISIGTSTSNITSYHITSMIRDAEYKQKFFLYSANTDKPTVPDDGKTDLTGEAKGTWTNSFSDQMRWKIEKEDYAIDSTMVAWSEPMLIKPADPEDVKQNLLVHNEYYYYEIADNNLLNYNQTWADKLTKTENWSIDGENGTWKYNQSDGWKLEQDFFLHWSGFQGWDATESDLTTNNKLTDDYKSSVLQVQVQVYENGGDIQDIVVSTIQQVPIIKAIEMSAKYLITSKYYISDWNKGSAYTFPVLTTESSGNISILAPVIGESKTDKDKIPVGDIGRWCYLYDRTVISGGAIVTGSITADKLKVNSLEAVSGMMGTLTAGEILSLGEYVENRIIPSNVDISTSTWEGSISNHTLSGYQGSATFKNSHLILVDSQNIKKITGGFCTGNINLTTVVIPSTVTTIEMNAFQQCSNLKYILLNEGLTYFGEYVFANTICEEIYLPKTLTNISRSAFWNCTNLKTVHYGGTQEDWNKIVWQGDTSINSILLSDTVTRVYYNGEAKDRWKISTLGDNFIESKNFTVSHDGRVNARAGEIGSFQLTETALIGIIDDQQAVSLSSQGLQILNSKASIKVGNFEMLLDDDDNTTKLYINGPLYLGTLKDDTNATGLEFVSEFAHGESNKLTANITLTMKPTSITSQIFDATFSLKSDKPLLKTTHYTVTFYIANRTIGGGAGSASETTYSHKFTIKKGATEAQIPYYMMHYNVIASSGFILTVQGPLLSKPIDRQATRDLSEGQTYSYSWDTVRQIIPLNNILVTGNLIPQISGQSYLYNLGEETRYWKDVFTLNGSCSQSDRNSKQNIENLIDQYTLVFDALQPVSYKLIMGSSGRTHTGFIAQQVKEAILNAGLTTQEFAAYCEWENSDGSIGCGLRYEEFIALCVDQIQKLKKRVEELENQLIEIKGE